MKLSTLDLVFFLILRVDERSRCNLLTLKFDSSRFEFWFLSKFDSFDKKKANSAIEQQKCKGSKFLTLK